MENEKSYIEEIETDYDLILHDDAFHTIDHVKDVLAKVGTPSHVGLRADTAACTAGSSVSSARELSSHLANTSARGSHGVHI